MVTEALPGVSHEHKASVYREFIHRAMSKAPKHFWVWPIHPSLLPNKPQLSQHWNIIFCPSFATPQHFPSV